MRKNKSAIVLCSGGLDSVTTAHYVKKRLLYDEMIILFFNYGQKSLISERKYAKKCAIKLRANFEEIDLNWLGKISHSLINKKSRIKKLNRADLKDTSKESEKYYVPCRNTLFLAYALALAESLYFKIKVKNDIFVGFKCEGKECYPDTTPQFVREINNLSKISSAGFKVYSPLIKMDKEDIIQLGTKLRVNFRDTFSCYIGKENHCGYCLACKLRQEGFYWAGIQDNTEYIP